jgi:hypothetical protein
MEECIEGRNWMVFEAGYLIVTQAARAGATCVKVSLSKLIFEEDGVFRLSDWLPQNSLTLRKPVEIQTRPGCSRPMRYPCDTPAPWLRTRLSTVPTPMRSPGSQLFHRAGRCRSDA